MKRGKKPVSDEEFKQLAEDDGRSFEDWASRFEAQGYTVAEIAAAEEDGRNLAPLISLLESGKPFSRVMRSELALLLRQRRLVRTVRGRPADRKAPPMQVNLNRAKAYIDMLRADMEWQIANGKTRMTREQLERDLKRHRKDVAEEYNLLPDNLDAYLDGGQSGNHKKWRRNLRVRKKP